MKAIKLYKIKWNLDKLSPEEKKETLKTLPAAKGFMADDDFDVVEKVPGILRKKYGYEIENYSYTEIPIYEDIETLLKTYTPKGTKPKKLYLKNGELSVFGEECVGGLKNDISKRFRLEDSGTDDDAMPKKLDMIMLSLEKILGISWDDADEKSVIKMLNKEVDNYLASKTVKDEDEAMDEGDSDFDEDEEAEEE